MYKYLLQRKNKKCVRGLLIVQKIILLTKHIKHILYSYQSIYPLNTRQKSEYASAVKSMRKLSASTCIYLFTIYSTYLYFILSNKYLLYNIFMFEFNDDNDFSLHYRVHL